MAENIERFVDQISDSLKRETFIKLTLGNYKGRDEHLQKLLVRLIKTKKGIRLFFLYRSDTRDTVKNYEFDAGVRMIADFLGKDFFSGHLFTTESDVQLEIGKKGRSRLNMGKPTIKTKAALGHDREKKLQIDPASFYLRALGITTDDGKIRDKQQDKWRQINKFVEILASLFEKSELKDRTELNIVDMGSGKGYLTFAAYDYFKNRRRIDVRITGVDTKKDMVGLCNDIAAASEFDGLKFVESSIEEFEIGNTDILIALHACNTATDDAIFKGISVRAELIIVAPCCHQEVRPQIKAPEIFKDILKHGVMLERMAETITDGLRSMLLERSGYSTKLFEFVSTEHTPKNNMLVGTKLATPNDVSEIAAKIAAIKELYGIR
ncbi:MAG: class I SAM-dependent methyltransferase, partial [Candidatus Binatia bacterium]